MKGFAKIADTNKREKYLVLDEMQAGKGSGGMHSPG